MLYIFSGPSLDHFSIRNALKSDSVICPPVKGGDILTLLSNEHIARPTHIHIIDGYYYNVPSVRHKEILQALKQGITVSGCSSMGAIRAAECKDFGMIGTGRVYEYFASNFLSGDDEIAVSHHPEPFFEKISTPLINLRFTIEDLCTSSKLDQNKGREIIEFFQQISFSDRHLKSLRGHSQFDEYYDLICKNYIDWKKVDALSSLALLINMKCEQAPTENQKFYSGYNHVNFYNDSAITSSKFVIDRNSLPQLLSKSNNLPKLLYDSYNRSLAVKFAKYLGITNSERDLKSFAIYVKTLKTHGIRYANLPLSYLNYSQEIIEQELLILKLHLWFIDSSGLVGNLGSISDYFSCILPLEQDLYDLTLDDRSIFYDSFLKLLTELSPTPNEILAKYIGLSREQFCCTNLVEMSGSV